MKSRAGEELSPSKYLTNARICGILSVMELQWRDFLCRSFRASSPWSAQTLRERARWACVWRSASGAKSCPPIRGRFSGDSIWAAERFRRRRCAGFRITCWTCASRTTFSRWRTFRRWPIAPSTAFSRAETCRFWWAARDCTSRRSRRATSCPTARRTFGTARSWKRRPRRSCMKCLFPPRRAWRSTATTATA